MVKIALGNENAVKKAREPKVGSVAALAETKAVEEEAENFVQSTPKQSVVDMDLKSDLRDFTHERPFLCCKVSTVVLKNEREDE